MSTKARILIIDDDPNLRKTLSDILKARGYAPLTAATGKAALEHIAQEKPSVALIDLKLDDMLGLKVMEEIKKRSPQTECIVVTGHATQASAIEAINLGAYSYVQKPYNLEHLQLTIQRAVEKHETERALRTSQDRYELATRAARVGVWDWDMKSGKSYIDPNIKAILGYSDEEIPNDLDVWTDYIHPEDRQSAMKVYQAHLEEQTPEYVYAHRALHKNGDVHWILIRGKAIRDAQGNVVRIIGTGTDITELRQVESQRDATLEALKKERDRAQRYLDIAEVILVALNEKGEIDLINRRGCKTLGYKEEELLGKNWFDTCLPAHTRGNVKVVFEKLIAGEVEPVEYYENPVVTRAGEVRTIAWHNTALTDDEGSITGTLSSGEDITERMQTEEALRESEKRFRTLSAATFEGIAFTEGGKIVDANPQFARILGYEMQELQGLDVEGLVAPEDRELVRRKILAGVEEPYEHRSLRKDGTVIFVEVRPRMMSIEGRALRMTAVRDITERKRAEAEIRRRNQELATLNEIGQTVTSTLDLQETLTLITQHSTRLLNVAATSLVLYDEGKDGLWFAAGSGEDIDKVLGQRLALGQGIVGWVVQHGKPALVPDVAQDPRWFGGFDQEGEFTTHSILCVPLQAKGRTIGALEVINKKEGPFGQEDLDLLSALAAPAATAIENARLFEAERTAREQAETLRQTTAALTSTLDLSQVLDSLLIYLGRVIPYDSSAVFLQEKDGLRAMAARGLPYPDLVLGHLFPLDNDLFVQLCCTQQPVFLDDARADPRFERWGGTDDIRGWMGVPLISRGECIGLMTLDSRQAATYTEAEARVAQAFANAATAAIHNAQLFDEVSTGRGKLQALSRRLVEVQEAERGHISRELHDETGQTLSSLLLGLSLLEREAHQPEAVITRAVELEEMVDELLENLHRLAMNLRPASLDHLGLIPALEHYTEIFGRQHNLIVQFETVGLAGERLPATIETTLYRIVQEALTNVSRHAQACQVDVVLKRRGEQIVTIVEDDGVGFDPETALKSGRLGLFGIQERAEMLGGTLTIESSSGAGTTILVEVPYAHPDSHR